MKVCITGGVGAGKSVVSKCIATLGYPVFNSDLEAKSLMNNDLLVKQELVSAFGENTFVNNVLNRSYLAEVVFNDETARATINSIVHPRVRQKFAEYAEENRETLVFNEAAILFETGAYKSFDKSILIIAPESLRIERVMARDNVSADQVKDRINAQWPDAKKKELADFIIINDDKTPLLEQIELVINQLNSLL